MKGTEKKALGRSVLNTSLSFVKGLVGGLNPVIGAVIGAGEGIVRGVQVEKDHNLASSVGGEGLIDPARLMGLGVFVVLTAGFVFGLISMDDLKELIKLFIKTQ